MDLNGKIVVFTGAMSLMTRNEAREIAVKLGAKLSDTVTSITDYLVVGKKPGSKLRAATRMRVGIINEQDWYKLCPKGLMVKLITAKAYVAAVPWRGSGSEVIKATIQTLNVKAPELDLD